MENLKRIKSKLFLSKYHGIVPNMQNGISIFIKLHNILCIFINIKNITIVMIGVSFSGGSIYYLSTLTFNILYFIHL